MNPRGTLGLLGTGAMGTGIAQVAATHGWQVKLMDTDRSIAEKAIEGVGKRLTRLVEKGRIDSADATAAMDRLQVIDSSAGHGDCDVVIEAIVEDLSIKVDAMMPMVEAAPQDAIIATNTSSLSVTELGEKLGVPERICGMHFFNPAPIMQLVEVIPGRGTSSSITDRAVDVASGWGKHVARASDTPGFIVNRVARPYYLEAFRCLEDGLGTPDIIDNTMKELGGFRMGPLELTDFIGHDVNTATTRTVWECWEKPSRLMPSLAQEQLVAEGQLGRKTGSGVYDWSGESPIPVLRPGQDAATLDLASMKSIRDFTSKASSGTEDVGKQIIFARILGALLNEALWAKHDKVALEADIDVAMRYGVNYPRGPFEWIADIGNDVVAKAMQSMEAMTGTGRFIQPH